MSGMEKLLARIKALFAPTRAARPSQEVEVTAPPAVAVAKAPEPRLPEPVAAAAEPAPVERVPLAAAVAPPVAEEAPASAPEIPAPAQEAPAFAEEVRTRTEDEEAPTDEEPVLADGLTLRLETERGSRSTFQVTKSGATIGRGPESTIQLADLSVSRKHARIAYRQGAYWLSDLGSMGGTWVDGAKLAAPRRVATGQTIDIGVCRLKVVAAVEEEKTGAAKGPSNAA